MIDNEIRLVDLIDVNVLQEIQDGFSKVTGLAALMVDEKGSPITQGSNFTDFCMKYVRQSTKGCKLCEKCDKRGGEITGATGRATAYVCHAGLMDFASPIKMNGRNVGAFIGGQALTSAPDDAHFARIAKNIDVDPDEFVEAVHKVNIVDKRKIEDAAAFLQTISNILSSMAITNYDTVQTNVQLIENIKRTDDLIREVSNVSDQTAHSISTIADRFNRLTEISKVCNEAATDCADVVNRIQENATTTHILGLNASIEASRAKEDGKGFGVIAAEVRKLADISKTSADVIQERIIGIGESTGIMSESAEEARELIDKCISDMEHLKTAVAQLNSSNFSTSAFGF